MPYPSGSDQFAIADRNQRDALIAHSGTADTAYPVRLVGENGALWTSIQGGTVQASGTIDVSGTIPVSGTVDISGTIPVSGTVSVAGTIPVSGTVGVSGTVPISGTVAISGTTPVSGTVTSLQGLNIPIHDTVQASYPDGTTETYVFKSGGTAGATVATVSVVYTDSTKGSLSLVLKS